MTESTITSKGQTTVPIDIRQAIGGGGAGTRLVWHVLSDGRVFVRAKNRSVLELKGSLVPAKGRRVALDKLRP